MIPSALSRGRAAPSSDNQKTVERVRILAASKAANKGSRSANSNVNLKFGTLEKKQVTAICNTENAAVVKSIGDLEARLDEQVVTKDEAKALRPQIEEL